jgi:hypothetical protein
MATLGGSILTLADHAKRLDPKGKTPKIVEMLSETNEIITDMAVKEGNLPTGHQATIRTGLPTTYWRLMNSPVPLSKSTTAQITENAGMLEAWSEVDEDVANLNGNVKSFRASEATAYMESMNQEMAETMFYGSAANPEEFVGFANRYNDLSAANAENILDAGGTSTDNASIWLIGWGNNEIFSVFPKGSKAGLSHDDFGLTTLQSGNDSTGVDGSRMRAYQERFKWKNGLVVQDWRYGARIANVDVSDLVAATGTQAEAAATAIIKLMSRAVDRLPRLSGVKPTFYANRTILSHLRVAALDKSNSAVTVESALNQFGNTIHETKFLGIPVRLVDKLTNAEARVV